MKSFKMEDVPEDVLWAYTINHISNQVGGLGKDMLEKYDKIVSKYPQWFYEEFDEKYCPFLPQDGNNEICVLCGKSKYVHNLK